MKATLEIPDDLYRKVKARSALEGRAIKAVAVQLFENWLEEKTPASTQVAVDAGDEAPWLAITREYVQPEMTHDMAEINEAISTAWVGRLLKN